MNRIRLIFSKRGFACFVRHVELPQLFGRIARRAGLYVALTQGMSPHPHIVMGPALPVGVVSLYEAAEIWFDSDVTPDEALAKMNAASPPGFRFLAAQRVPLDAMSLGKRIGAAKYWLCPRDESTMSAAFDALGEELPAGVLARRERTGDGLELVMLDPSQNGPGVLVKALAAHGVITGWADVCAARLLLGEWRANTGEITPLL